MDEYLATAHVATALEVQGTLLLKSEFGTFGTDSGTDGRILRRIWLVVIDTTPPFRYHRCVGYAADCLYDEISKFVIHNFP